MPPRTLPLMPTVSCCATGSAGVSPGQAAAAAALFKALGDPVRLRLFSRIAGATEPVCVCDIQEVGVSQPTVSHHLRRLREVGLVDCERRGTWVYYRVVPEALEQARRALGA